MHKSQINPLPEFYDRYIHLVKEDEIYDAFSVSLKALEELDLEKFTWLADKRYQENKWTCKDIFQHIIDNERVQSYRALRFARNDQTELPGYEEDFFASNTNCETRDFEGILEELKTLRRSTIQLFRSFDAEMLMRSGIASNKRISVLAIAFVITGHQVHHLNVIKERYFPLLSKNA